MAADYQLVIIGAGLSGLAAGIRAARFGAKTLIVEQHHRAGGLNSWYTQAGRLLESGLHAMTNCVPPERKKAPLNLIFRQLNLSRRDFLIQEQWTSEIVFPGASLAFANDPALLAAEVERQFPGSGTAFQSLREAVAAFDPYKPAPWQSARAFVLAHLREPLLADMLLLPLMLYGNAEEHDMALSAFVILFRAVFEEGLFRPAGGIRGLLDLLLRQYENFGGEIRFQADVEALLTQGDRVTGLRLTDGTAISAEAVISTAGLPETMRLTADAPVQWPQAASACCGAMSFTETISVLPESARESVRQDRTMIFYHQGQSLRYQRPEALQDASWGIICFPEHFGETQTAGGEFSVRVSNPASFPHWQELRAQSAEAYRLAKQQCRAEAVAASESYVGSYANHTLHQDTFTPLTIARFTRKAGGAIYGSPVKVASGETPWTNLFLAGTDQGLVGIVGAMMSGISIVNQRFLR